MKLFLTAALFLITIFGCSSVDDLSDNLLGYRIYPSIIKDIETDTLTVGETALFSIEASGKNISYQWLKNGIPTASQNSEFQFIAELIDSNSTIQCIVFSGSDTVYSSKVTICVKKLLIAVQSVSINKESASIFVGSTEQLKAAVSPLNAADTSIRWISLDTAIAVVDTTGLVTAKSSGNVKIVAKSSNGLKSDTCTVNMFVHVESVSLNKTKLNVPVGTVTSQLNASINPADASNKTLFWNSSNSAVAAVSANGIVTAKAEGTTFITVTSNEGGKTAVCTLTVSIPVTGIYLDTGAVQLIPNGTPFKLNYSISPENATNKKVRWSSSDTSAAAVDSVGLVTPHSAGKAFITAVTDDGSRTSSCEITVAINAASVAFSTKELQISVRSEPKQLIAEVYPVDASNKKLSWSTSNADIVSVDSAGVITPAAAGTAMILVKTEDGGKSDDCKIVVTDSIIPVIPEMISIKAGSFTMGDQVGTGESDEKPVHRVSVSAFKMSKYEITQKEFVQVMAYNPSFVGGNDNRPVDNLTWFDAIRYCNARSKLEGKDTVYTYSSAEYSTQNKTGTKSCSMMSDLQINFSKNGYRLPTEAEWEYACKAETEGLIYGKASEIAWHLENCGGGSYMVGQKQPNTFGLYDMVGNLQEWCSDWYFSYTADSVNDPVGRDTGSHRIVKGGSTYSSASTLRASYRNRMVPQFFSSNIGFRCVCN